MKRILTLTAVAAMVFTACSKEESTGTGDKQVRITPTIANPALTPASMSSGTRATDTDFELNDKVGLTITMTADGSAFGMGYFPSSTGYKVTYNTADDPESGIKNIQYYAGMITYNKSYNRMTIAYQGGYGAAPVRCIKNKE